MCTRLGRLTTINQSGEPGGVHKSKDSNRCPISVSVGAVEPLGVLVAASVRMAASPRARGYLLGFATLLLTCEVVRWV
jgi:hypothetical protein